MTLEKLGTYAIEKRLSAHQNREVFLAHDGVQTVILKRLRLGQMRDWKAMQLFEREADTLKALRHPRIPRLLDSFHEEQAGQTSLMMVMEYVAGPSLADRLKQGWRPREPEVLEIARQGLEILSYLHQHDPPVIHRDIKPSNLIWTDDQELYLVDFGAVRDIFVQKGASTVIGTFGYMAPEQFAGQTVPASDLYGLGATLLHLLSGRPPSEIPHKHLMPDFRPYVTCPVELQRFLELLLVPDLEERFADTTSALTSLQSLSKVRESSPSGRLVYVRDGEDVRIELNASLNPLAIWSQYRNLLLVLTAYTGIMGLMLYFFYVIVIEANSYKNNLGFVGFVTIYALISSLLFLFATRQMVQMVRERWLLRLNPEQMTLEKNGKKPESMTIPKRAIREVRRNIAASKLSREGVALSLDPAALPDGQPAQLDLAMGLGKWDHHWLMTKLLQYSYQANKPELDVLEPRPVEAARNQALAQEAP